MRRVGVQERANPDGGDTRGREAIVCECRTSAVAAAAAHGGDRAMSRAERPQFVSTTLPHTIREPLLPHVAGVRGHRTSLPSRRRPRRTAENHVRTIKIKRARKLWFGRAIWWTASYPDTEYRLSTKSPPDDRHPTECEQRFLIYVALPLCCYICYYV